MVTIDVLLPFYGNFSFFQRAVSSVLASKDSDFRLLICNDGDTSPNVRPWIQSLNDKRITYLENATNIGALQTFNRLLSLAVGDYVIFMGADDLMGDTLIGTFREYLSQNSDVDVVHPHVCVIDEHERPYQGIVDFIKKFIQSGFKLSDRVNHKRLVRSLAIGNWTYFPSMVWRTNTIQNLGFQGNLSVCQDLDLLLRVVNEGGTFTYLTSPYPLFKYRRHKENDSTLKIYSGVRFREEREVYSKYARYYWKHRDPITALLFLLRLTPRLHVVRGILSKNVDSRNRVKMLLNLR